MIVVSLLAASAVRYCPDSSPADTSLPPGPTMFSCNRNYPEDFSRPDISTDGWIVFDIRSGKVYATQHPHNRYEAPELEKLLDDDDTKLKRSDIKGNDTDLDEEITSPVDLARILQQADPPDTMLTYTSEGTENYFEIDGNRAVIVFDSSSAQADASALLDEDYSETVGTLDEVEYETEEPDIQETPRWVVLGGLVGLLILGICTRLLSGGKGRKAR